ncbi:SRPBCC family protein [Herbiconiux moechotypicola]|nr:SRPBCC family protein [Herbiconiux moechotypicola]MCS5731543.1 SRPBCC family protein [Herbiconiux moechotypicola]
MTDPGPSSARSSSRPPRPRSPRTSATSPGGSGRSPWEGQDPNLKRAYTGTPGEVGSTYAWNGNRKAGAGTMVVTRVDPAEIGIDLAFTAPFKSTSTVTFRFVDEDAATRVVWSMQSPENVMAKIMRVFINMDKLIGADFDKGLTQLKAEVESPST